LQGWGSHHICRIRLREVSYREGVVPVVVVQAVAVLLVVVVVVVEEEVWKRRIRMEVMVSAFYIIIFFKLSSL
jgi:hypothetical protein